MKSLGHTLFGAVSLVFFVPRTSGVGVAENRTTEGERAEIDHELWLHTRVAAEYFHKIAAQYGSQCSFRGVIDRI